MRNLKAEIYVNRALLWLIFAQVSLGNGVGKPLIMVNAALVILNLISACIIEICVHDEKESDDS